MINIFIDGQTGTTAIKVKEKLLDINAINLIELGDADRKNLKYRKEAINAADFIFLCLPDTEAKRAITLIENPKVKVIDASSAHRTNSNWVFGLPELGQQQKKSIISSKRVSNPGCFSTGAILLLSPLVQKGIISPNDDLHISGISGYTGGGKNMISKFENPEDDNYLETHFRYYSLGQEHKHLPEIIKYSGLNRSPTFLPSVGRFPQGMIITIPYLLKGEYKNKDARFVSNILNHAYADFPTVNLCDTDQCPTYLDPNKYFDRDDVTLRIYDGVEKGQIIMTAQYDNLGKGASGAAVQNFKLMASLS